MTINPTAPAPLTDALDPATPFKRLMGSMATSYAGAFIVSIVPVTLLLTVHLSAIAGAGAASAFSVVTGVAALLGLIAQPLTGRFSDRTRARFGKRRSWILTGGLVGSLILGGMSFTTEVWQVVLVWALVSIFINVQFAATGALLAEQVPAKRRGSMSGVLGSMAIVGPVLGLAAVSFFTSAPWLQWIIVAGSGMLLVVISVSLLHDPQQERPAGEPRLTVRDLAKSFWLSPRRHPAFGWAWAVRFLVTCAGASTSYNALLLINRFHYAPAALAGRCTDPPADLPAAGRGRSGHRAVHPRWRMGRREHRVLRARGASTGQRDRHDGRERRVPALARTPPARRDRGLRRRGPHVDRQR